jgi:hypothetical protein
MKKMEARSIGILASSVDEESEGSAGLRIQEFLQSVLLTRRRPLKKGQQE